ncbi:MAG TPA: ABC transporter ATP-binding protein, partial [Bifidobacterium longum]|nr:ABC transporter ATP-binding protein [Bifidobacterium longum]
FADEPTGALDQATGREVMGILMAAARDNGSAVVVVTHDPNVASFCGRTVMMQDGRLRQTDANPDSAPAGGGCQPQADWGWPEGAEPPSASLRSAAPAGGSETTAGGAR